MKNQKDFMDIRSLKKQVIIETFRSSGPGGQRKNKTETAVRIKHLPTGITVIATEHRHQSKNIKLAFDRLRARLTRLNKPKKKRIPTSVPLREITKRVEEKRILSAKKRLRQRFQKEEKWD